MTPIRVEEFGVEPVSLAEMRGYLRLDGDDGEDGLIDGLVTAARAWNKATTRWLVRLASYQLMLTAWPAS